MASNTFVKSMEAYILNFIFNGTAIGFATTAAETNRSIGLFYLDAPSSPVSYDEYGSLYPSSATNTTYPDPASAHILEPMNGCTYDTGYERQEITFTTATTTDPTTLPGTPSPRSLSNDGPNNQDISFPVCTNNNYFASAALAAGTYGTDDGSGNGLVSGWAVFSYNTTISDTAAINGQAHPIITGKFTTAKAILVDDQAKIAANNLTITLD